MSGLVWPALIVFFDAIVFLIAVYLIRLAARDRVQEVNELEQAEQMAVSSTAIETQPEQEMGHIPAMG